MKQPNLNELIENFSLFSDWEERYKYLIDLGKNLEPMAESLKTDGSLVRGCTSRVWLICETNSDGAFHFIADSDAHIVRGLIAILLSAFEGKTAKQIKEVDIHAAFDEIGLGTHLSPNRRNGFFAMVERVKRLANN